MLLSIFLLIVGLVLVVLGADWLVDGASAIARKAGLSEFVIGLTIVGFGTSMPELVVSLTGAIEGLSDVSIGNVVGSNIFNTLLILGLTAVMIPVAISDENRKRDIPITLAATALLVFYGMKHSIFGLGVDGISRIGGIVFLVLFAWYLYSCFKNDTGAEEAEDKKMPLWAAVLLCIVGIAGLVGGGQLFVDYATDIAQRIGVPEKFIAITVLAGGTSLPELVTCIVAAAKHKDQLALGNILGSNVFNILLILGAAAVVRPIVFEQINFVDMGVLLLSAVVPLIFAYTGHKNKIDRAEGAIMLALFAAYYVWLFCNL